MFKKLVPLAAKASFLALTAGVVVLGAAALTAPAAEAQTRDPAYAAARAAGQQQPGSDERDLRRATACMNRRRIAVDRLEHRGHLVVMRRVDRIGRVGISVNHYIY